MNRILMAGLIAFTSACAASDLEPYDDAWGSDDVVSGKADGVLDNALPLVLGTAATGALDESALGLYQIDLQAGDQIKIVEKVTSGDLAPHFTLYFGASNHVSSATFSRTTKSVTKAYDLTATGRYYLVVRPYRNEGSGRYTVTASCTAGPCDGTPVDVPLSIEERGTCVAAARECSFAALPAYNGAVAAGRARTIFQRCVADGNVDGKACTNACVGDAEAAELCEGVIDTLPFYADHSAACFAEVQDCLEECAAAGDSGEPSSVGETTIAMCWMNGLNSTCDAYAREHAKCGGSYVDDSNEECHALCESTFGVWNDDLDTRCVESCD
jgi:hypothetical protein